MDKWYDVQDDEGHWRIGHLVKTEQSGVKLIYMDGFHPTYNAYYCPHSKKIAPIRTHTWGLTTPEKSKPLRTVLKIENIESLEGRINLYIIQNKLLELQPIAIRVYIRTQFLIHVDKIMTTPFQLIRQAKMLDIAINKVFINLLNFYYKVIETSKKFMVLYDQSETANQLYNSLYELTILASMILGVNLRSKSFYENQLNLTIRCEGFFDYLIKSDGILPFKLLLKNLGMIKKPTAKNYKISVQVIDFILNMCEKYKNQLMYKINDSTIMVIQQAITHLKDLIQKSQEIKDLLATNLSLISRIQSVYAMLRPKKQCTLRKLVEKKKVEEQKIQEKPIIPQKVNIQLNEQQNTRFQKLQTKIKMLQELLNQKQTLKINKLEPKRQENLPVQNLGQQMFLGSLQWALQTSDIETAKKLVKWRRTLLQIGRITGWEVALAIGCKTYKKCEIGHEDIIEANYDYIMKQSSKEQQ